MTLEAYTQELTAERFGRRDWHFAKCVGLDASEYRKDEQYNAQTRLFDEIEVRDDYAFFEVQYKPRQRHRIIRLCYHTEFVRVVERSAFIRSKFD